MRLRFRHTRARINTTIAHLEHLGATESAQPEEAPLGGSLPHAGEHVEDIRLRTNALEPEYLVVVRHHAFN